MLGLEDVLGKPGVEGLEPPVPVLGLEGDGKWSTASVTSGGKFTEGVEGGRVGSAVLIDEGT